MRPSLVILLVVGIPVSIMCIWAFVQVIMIDPFTMLLAVSLVIAVILFCLFLFWLDDRWVDRRNKKL